VKRRVIQCSIGLAACTLVGLLSATDLYLYLANLMGRPMAWRKAMWEELRVWYLWGALTPLLVWLVRRHPLESRRWRRALLVYVPAAALLPAAHLVVCATWNWAFERRFGRTEAIHTWTAWLDWVRLFFLVMFFRNLITFAGLIGAISAIEYYRRFRDRDVRAARLESQLAHARLEALRAQLHPHFLFNTLNAIAALVHENPQAADRMIARLSELLRISLDDLNTQVPLWKEIDFARKYLEIERIRFADRLALQWRIDPDVMDALVPSLLLQPLVENAVRHGLAATPHPCRIEVVAQRREGRLHIAVLDTGPGLCPASAARREGVGLRTTRARLQHSYGEDFSIRLSNRDGGGCAADLAVPLDVDGGS